jgi:hypothetical protein
MSDMVHVNVQPWHKRDCVVPRDGLALDSRCTCGLREEVLEAWRISRAEPDVTDFQSAMLKVSHATLKLGQAAYVGCVGVIVLTLVALLGVAIRAWGLL